MSTASLNSLLKKSKRVLISTHVLPDGDGLGAEHALYHYLKRARKSVRVYNPDPLPPRYRFLDPEGKVLLGPGEVELWDQCDLWIVVDTNDPRRLGRVWQEMSLRVKQIVFLDHHQAIPGLKYPRNSKVLADTQSSSIGELLYEFFQETGRVKLNRDIALGLYVSVMTDTNSFRYSRTTPAAHRIAAEMIEHGVNPEEVYQAIFSSKEVSHLQLLGQVLQNVRVSSNGRLAWIEMPLELRRKHRASADDTQSFLNLLLLLKDAEVVCLFREEEDGATRVSIKSKGRVVVSEVAAEFGGGGHEFAAGLATTAPFAQVRDRVVERLELAIRDR